MTSQLFICSTFRYRNTYSIEEALRNRAVRPQKPPILIESYLVLKTGKGVANWDALLLLVILSRQHDKVLKMIRSSSLSSRTPFHTYKKSPIRIQFPLVNWTLPPATSSSRSSFTTTSVSLPHNHRPRLLLILLIHRSSYQYHATVEHIVLHHTEYYGRVSWLLSSPTR